LDQGGPFVRGKLKLRHASRPTSLAARLRTLKERVEKPILVSRPGIAQIGDLACKWIRATRAQVTIETPELLHHVRLGSLSRDDGCAGT